MAQQQSPEAVLDCNVSNIDNMFIHRHLQPGNTDLYNQAGHVLYSTTYEIWSQSPLLFLSYGAENDSKSIFGKHYDVV